MFGRRGDWFDDLFGFEEHASWRGEGKEYEKTKAKFEIEGEMLVSLVNKSKYHIGVFDTPSLADLRVRGQVILAGMEGHLKVSHARGDVSVMQADSANRLATFQAASQFNCLEFTGPGVTPEQGVTGYVGDRTQGPACSVSCGPATVYRNYFAPVPLPDGTLQEGQTATRQIDNLAAISKRIGNIDNRFFSARSGYTMADDKGLREMNEHLASLDEDGLDEIRALLRVGAHCDVQVTSKEWGGVRVEDEEQMITQVFASGCSVSYSGNGKTLWSPFASLVLEAAYEATFWLALINAHNHGFAKGSRRLYLTNLGGGVFGNSFTWISHAMRRACEIFAHADLDVRMVSYARPDRLVDQLVTEFQARAEAAGSAVTEAAGSAVVEEADATLAAEKGAEGDASLQSPSEALTPTGGEESKEE